MTQRILKKQLAWVVEHGKVGVSTDILFRPVSPIPHALVDANGFPYKDSKSMHQNSLQMFPVVISSLPQGWIPYLKVCSSSKHIQWYSSMSLSCRVQELWSHKITKEYRTMKHGLLQGLTAPIVMGMSLCLSTSYKPQSLL